MPLEQELRHDEETVQRLGFGHLRQLPFPAWSAASAAQPTRTWDEMGLARCGDILTEVSQ